jgi:hypothetical protein
MLEKRYDGGNTLKWNLEVEPFVVWWVVEMEKDTCELRAIEVQMSPWGVTRMEICLKIGTRFMAKVNQHPWMH